MLWKASAEGDLEECIRLCDDLSIDVDETHKSWMPLMKASEEGHIEIVAMLLDRGADFNMTNKKGHDSVSFVAAPSMNRWGSSRSCLRSIMIRWSPPGVQPSGVCR